MKKGQRNQKSDTSIKKSNSGNINVHKQGTKIVESIPNENLYTEQEYRMKGDLKFELDSDEQNCQKNVFLRNYEVIKYLYCTIIIGTILSTFLKNEDWQIKITNSIIFIISTIGILMISNVTKFINHLPYFRYFIESANLLLIYATMSNINLNVHLIFSRLTVCFIYNITFNLTFSESIKLYLIEYFMFLLNYGDYPNISTRVFYNLFSSGGLTALTYLIMVNFLQFPFSKGLRELWAMYDSFKRSYFMLKNICDESPYPIFVISMKKQNTNIGGANPSYYYVYQTYYKNTEAEKLSLMIKNMRGTGREKAMNSKILKIDINFKDLFEKSMEKLLEKELEKCIQKEIKYFDFPLIIGEANLSWKHTADFPTLYEGELENIQWVRIIVSPTIWKGVECLMVQIMENDDIRNNFFVQEYESLINNEFLKVINNNDTLCKKATDLKVKEKKIMLINNAVTPDYMRSPSQTNNLKSPLITRREIVRSPQPGKSPQNTNNYEKLFNANNSFKLTLNGGSNFKKSFDSNDVQITKTEFDYSTLFYFKSSVNYIYDMYLTINTFNSLRMNQIQKKWTLFNFEKLVRSLISYFSPILKIKNIQINFSSESDGEINAIYDYYRVIFFNIILFVLNNTKTRESELVLNINVSHMSFTDEGENVYEVTFVFQDESPIIDYNKVAEMLASFKLTEMKTACIQKFKIIDIGLVISSFIVTYVYNSDFKVSSKDNVNQITFLIYNHTTQTVNTDENLIKRFELEDKYYNRIAERVFKWKKVAAPVVRMSSPKITKRTNEEDDRFNPEEDKHSLSDDLNKCKELFIHLNRNLDFSEKILDSQNYIKKFELIKTQSKKLKYEKLSSEEYEFKAKWDNTSTINNIKYCPIPRFLIVEDNIVGRMSIKDELKRLRLEQRHDIAADGREAVDKFKILLNQGYMFDFIFMDIYLPEMGGIEATKAIRNIEDSYKVHNNIVAVTVEGKRELEEGLFDDHFEKPIKNSDKFFSYISKHFKTNRPDILFKDIK